MTTTAPSFVGSDAHLGNDAMDLHSDNGYNIHDGDIDLDLDSAPGTLQEDDVLSLKDAGTDAGTDLQNALGDQDEFMVDKEDVIEEDEAGYTDLHLEDADESGPPNVLDQVLDNPVDEITVELALDVDENNVEEDLLDYSDDEEQVGEDKSDTQPAQAENPTSEFAPVQDTTSDQANYNSNHNHEDAHQVPHEENTDETGLASWTGGDGESMNQQSGNDQPDLQQAGADELAAPFLQQTTDETQTAIYGENQTESAEAIDNDHSQEAHEVSQADAEPQEPHEYQEHQESHVSDHSILPLITVNYDGAEYWLFKPHQDDEGEWLLENESLANEPITHLFSACRSQLGDDLSSGTELGFRFEHFHGMELYEDSTACAVSQLSNLVDLYLQLHAQDGNNDPESFYITLQFRPRVISLLSDLQKAVHDQVGFSGLDRAIASGQTNFNSSYVSHPTEQGEQWGSNDHEEDHDNAAGEDQDETVEDDEEKGSNHDSPSTEEAHGSTRSSVSGAEDEASETQEAPEPIAQHDSSGSPSANESDGDEVEAVYKDEDGADEYDEDGDDLVDYSDDEDASNGNAAEENTQIDHSSRSSTVQGNDVPAEIEEGDGATYEDEEEDELNDEGLTELGVSEMYGQYQEATDPDETNYEDTPLEQVYPESYSQNGEDAEADEYAAAETHEDNTDYYYDDGNVNLEENDALKLNDSFDTEGRNDTLDDRLLDNATGEVVDADDFLDLTGADSEEMPEKVTQNIDATSTAEVAADELYSAHGQTSLAETDVTDPSTASYLENQDIGSPQGQKRPIDEVDVGQDGADEFTDYKRPKM
ncbi:hypothetical protein BU24DRAFT_47821 [Aaosphaeria arxii CBS 175.79]|uniref:Uncharacterized protein n=1 Tax=Aaosphaeria arxii CBS 175.79 TaxID=1450172 RepID=A0A6A5XD96_9PLEO|nr:uncharacterized protein BU24DRAFT_47821 [Aaosphaeria arxii CBS 175.79]KAF2010870.1 hypothetical protein BU24DRAFT_47821 [Aaosphaeria arxii CBS 175.79]